MVGLEKRYALLRRVWELVQKLDGSPEARMAYIEAKAAWTLAEIAAERARRRRAHLLGMEENDTGALVEVRYICSCGESVHLVRRMGSTLLSTPPGWVVLSGEQVGHPGPIVTTLACSPECAKRELSKVIDRLAKPDTVVQLELKRGD